MTEILKSFLFFQISCLALSVQAAVVYDQPLFGEEMELGFKLSWSTLEEVNASHFIIERALEEEFYPIGTVQAKGVSLKGSKYFFVDNMLGLLDARYRLRQVDKDGTSHLSEPIKLSREFASTWAILNNEEVHEDVYQIDLEVMRGGVLELILKSDKSNQILWEKELEAGSGLNNFELDLSNRRKGNYRLEITFEGQQKLISYVKKTEPGVCPDAVSKKSNQLN